MRPMHFRPGMTDQPRSLLLNSWSKSPKKADLISCRQLIVSLRSTTTARFGPSNRCIFSSSSHSTGSRRLRPSIQSGRSKEPFASLLKGDVKGALAGGEPAIFQIMMATHAGMTTEEFEQLVTDWVATAKHPVTKKPYTDMVYQPMLEVLAYLNANGFKTFIVSGGGVEFMRPWVQKTYGISPERVIGSSAKLRFDLRDGTPMLMKLPELNFFDDKAGKPVAIQTYIGRRPIAAFGNSDGDLQMLQWTCAGSGARFCLYVHHTDAAREWAYDRQSHIGQLDKGLDEAKAKGWTVVDMKNDWKTIFPFGDK